jgi:hypothetical protein
MLTFIGKLGLKLLRHELKKQSPAIKSYLIMEVNLLCDEFKEFADEKIATAAESIEISTDVH